MIRPEAGNRLSEDLLELHSPISTRSQFRLEEAPWMSAFPRISPRNFGVKNRGKGNPSCVWNKGASGGPIHFAGRCDIGHYYFLESNYIHQCKSRTMLPKEKLGPLSVGSKLRNPEPQGVIALPRWRGVPDAPSRPGDHGVQRRPHNREHDLWRRKARLVELPIPGLVIPVAAESRAVPGGAGSSQAKSG